MAMTLEELKAANAEAEAAQTDENAEVEIDDSDTPQVEEELEEAEAETEEAQETDGEAETPEDEGEETDLEDWMKGDSHESQAEKKFTDGDIGIVKTKLKAKLGKQYSGEIEERDAKIEELEAKLSAGSITRPSELSRPKRDDFYDNDDPDGAYEKAFEDYLIAKTRAERVAETATAEQTKIQQDQARKISQGEDAHYERAASLVKKSGISAEKYQAADSAFRGAIESIVPDGGDDIAAALMARLGNGSEKVVFNLGISESRLSEFKDLLKSDPSGLDAYGYLVERKVELTSSEKRKTNAPKPAPDIKSDAAGNAALKSLKKQYKAANSAQQRFDLRLKAKAAGAKDVNDW